MIEIQRITPILAYQENNKQNERNQKILSYEKEKSFKECIKNNILNTDSTDATPVYYQNNIQFAYDSLQSEIKLIKLKLM